MMSRIHLIYKNIFRLSVWMAFIRYELVVRKFANRPKKLFISKDVYFQHPEHISWGEGCHISKHAAFFPLHEHFGKNYPSEIKIGNNVHFGAYDKIASAYSVIIEDNVLFADFVHVTDHSHGYEDVNLPVKLQDIIHKGPIVIGEGSWLAFGCHVLSGVKIGKHCVVAANSVVTKDVPSYSIVAGNPARIVKKYNFETKKWEKV